MKYIIQVALPVCPICSSAVVRMPNPLFLKCWDCKTSFKLIDYGITEREMLYEVVNNENKYNKRFKKTNTS